MAEYLKRRGGNYYVRVPSPRHLWASVGKREIVRTTGTGDVSGPPARRVLALVSQPASPMRWGRASRPTLTSPCRTRTPTPPS